MKCKKKVIYSASVSNGWTKDFEVPCGSYGDGKKRYCKKCKQKIILNK
jgi:hypothetical protein